MAGLEDKREMLEDEKDERVPVYFLNQNSRLLSVEYPGFIKNISKVLQTLGGEKTINTKLKDPARRVELCLRPEDPYAKKAFADRFQVTDILMKVKRRRKKGQDDEEYQYECQIVGVIDTAVKFKGLVDFQYLAPDIPDLLGVLHGSEILDIDTPLHVPPPVFARLDHSFDYQFRSERRPKDGNANASVDRPGGPLHRKPRPSNAITCGFNAPAIPSAPKPGALKEMKRYKNEGLDIAQKLFNTRPIWSRKAVAYHMGKKAIRIQHILPCVGYYWLGGPWGKLWNKFGYDPRQNSAAKIYQRLDFRLRNKKSLRSVILPPTTRNVHDSFHTGIQRLYMNVSGVVPTGVGSQPGSSGANIPSAGYNAAIAGETLPNLDKDLKENRLDLENPQVLPYVFHPTRPPPTRQVNYQLCDIHCAEVQKIISANDGKETVCNINGGWLSPVTYEKIRQVLSDTLLELFEKQQASITNQEGTSSAGDGGTIEDIGEEEETFLETLMDDDDVEAYDLLGDEF